MRAAIEREPSYKKANGIALNPQILAHDQA